MLYRQSNNQRTIHAFDSANRFYTKAAGGAVCN